LQSRGSLEELIDDLNACHDEQYVATEQIASLKAEGWRVRQLIDGYIRYLRQQKNAPSTVEETPPSYNDSLGLEDDSRFTILRFTISNECHFQNLARRCERRRISRIHYRNIRGHGCARCRARHSADAGERSGLSLELQGGQ